MTRLPIRDCRSYLMGAMHDGCVHGSTVRICQKEESYVAMIKALILDSGSRAWTYREGKLRNLFVVEFSHSFVKGHQILTPRDIIHYARGFFDAEGGVPSDVRSYPYIYFAQKDRAELQDLRNLLLTLGIVCGTMHRPSRRADPEYWRFYVSRESHSRFARAVGSWHPRKGPILEAIAREGGGGAHPTSGSPASPGSARTGCHRGRRTPRRSHPSPPLPPSGGSARRGRGDGPARRRYPSWRT